MVSCLRLKKINIMEVQNMDRLERVLGGLFGVACGDALGGTLEFTHKNIGVEKYGYHKDIIGGGKMHLKPGQVTDDTVMTIAVAEGILENANFPIAAIGKRFVEWYKTDPIDIGITCQEAIDGFIHCGDWMEASLKIYKYSNGRNAGNGTLMRCIPAALVRVIGISDHHKAFFMDSPKYNNFDEYIDEINYLKNKYMDKINVKAGIEINLNINEARGESRIPYAKLSKADFVLLERIDGLATFEYPNRYHIKLKDIGQIADRINCRIGLANMIASGEIVPGRDLIPVDIYKIL